jgi:hypothetical protein
MEYWIGGVADDGFDTHYCYYDTPIRFRALPQRFFEQR